MGLTNPRRVTVAGSWTVEEQTVVDDEGFTPGVSITDGRSSIVTTASPAELMIALAQHLEVESFGPTGKRGPQVSDL